MMARIALERCWEYSTEATFHQEKESTPLPIKYLLYLNQIRMALTPDSVRSTARVHCQVSFLFLMILIIEKSQCYYLPVSIGDKSLFNVPDTSGYEAGITHTLVRCMIERVSCRRGEGGYCWCVDLTFFKK